MVADGSTAGGLAGFRIVGDAATPLGVGLLARDAAVSVVDVEITGATQAALDLAGAGASLVGGDIHDNPGLGLVVRAGASPRIAHSAFNRNGTPEGIGPSFVGRRGRLADVQQQLVRWSAPAARRRAAGSARLPPSRASMTESVFSQIGPYAIRHEINQGGMATVYLAEDTRSGRQVALRRVMARDQDILDAERRGAELQQLFWQHSKSVPEIFETFTSGGAFVVAMEYLAGQDLSELIRQGPVEPARACEIAIALVPLPRGRPASSRARWAAAKCGTCCTAT